MRGSDEEKMRGRDIVMALAVFCIFLIGVCAIAGVVVVKVFG